jgi:hypothetical protein
VANTPREECARRLGASHSKRMAASWSRPSRPTEYKVAVRRSRPTASSPRIKIVRSPYRPAIIAQPSRLASGEFAERAITTRVAARSRHEAYFLFFIAAVTYGFLPACAIQESTWLSSSSSTAVNSTPRVALPILVGVTGGSGCSSLPRMNISFR